MPPTPARRRTRATHVPRKIPSREHEQGQLPAIGPGAQHSRLAIKNDMERITRSALADYRVAQPVADNFKFRYESRQDTLVQIGKQRGFLYPLPA